MKKTPEDDLPPFEDNDTILTIPPPPSQEALDASNAMHLKRNLLPGESEDLDDDCDSEQELCDAYDFDPERGILSDLRDLVMGLMGKKGA